MKVFILSGGKGTRLFPISREKYPKQYLKIFDSKSLFQMAVERAMRIGDEVAIITNDEQKFIVRDQLDEISAEAEILVEPASKNTFPAIIYASLHADDTFLITPSDHFIKGDLARYIRRAEKHAGEFIITFGIKPTKPHTGYGYIKPGERAGEVFRVERFTEKPDMETAKRFVSEGYLWNSGMFLTSREVLREEVRRHYPGLYEAFEKDVGEGYRRCPETSFDYAIMERTERAAVMELDIFWSDLGSFDSLYEVMEKDENGNAVRGELISLDSRNNLVMSDRLVSAIGVEDLLIVDTRDALLISKKGVAERVREVVRILKERGDERAEVHTVVHRPWGSYVLLERGENYWIKRIVVKPGERLSLQRHMHRSEHWIVVRGMAKVISEGKEYFLRPGESTFVPSGVKHRLVNPGRIPLEMIEVAIGDYLSEDDIERFDDEYGRG
ncbi:mannose-1-phosphate guanylyltransferase/mannose-6-phosphate isomerase [Geoglobus ahangari]|uniref:mannose-1-phosphate guanylyltransferase n=1 Tax=Geoglobus ahangari TaxID=113653 RepID=A0A0F7DC18_9EURY|nr:mannose-1-phosphate guanylyltransferase/mannose-6-phosphate isomerase [Geoglobus ahangari]AKG92066.1 mannose-1-phosphate guanylyltransferase/mannose-6-phosphate isomerase [Geoglobus ahangari]